MTTVQALTSGALNTTWQNAPTHTINAGGVEFAYRQLGPSTGVPVVFLTHLAAVLDNWDPRVSSPTRTWSAVAWDAIRAAMLTVAPK
jgi:hypothetical protein